MLDLQLAEAETTAGTESIAKAESIARAESIEVLDQRIHSLACRLNATEFEFLVLIREFDERGGFLKWGLVNCVQWLHWRCDLSLNAAREKLRVAHACKPLPEISAAFSAGKLSYSKVRALTRVATPRDEEGLLEFALQVSASVVEQRCQQLRNVHPESVDVARRAYDARSFRAYREPARGRMSITIELPLEEGELILNALDRVVHEHALDEPDAGPTGGSSFAAMQADALLAMCREHLRGGVRDATSRAGNAGSEASPNAGGGDYQVVIHVDQAALSGEPAPGARSDLPVETVKRLSCDGAVIPMLDGQDGSVLSIGRKRRTVPIAIKRALWARDRHCRFPGCTHTRFVDAHHVAHWAHGGETGLDNLLLLCSHHHRLVHEGGFLIRTDHAGRRYFQRPDGRAVPEHGYRVDDRVDEP